MAQVEDKKIYVFLRFTLKLNKQQLKYLKLDKTEN